MRIYEQIITVVAGGSVQIATPDNAEAVTIVITAGGAGVTFSMTAQWGTQVYTFVNGVALAAAQKFGIQMNRQVPSYVAVPYRFPLGAAVGAVEAWLPLPPIQLLVITVGAIAEICYVWNIAGDDTT